MQNYWKVWFFFFSTSLFICCLFVFISNRKWSEISFAIFKTTWSIVHKWKFRLFLKQFKAKNKRNQCCHSNHEDLRSQKAIYRQHKRNDHLSRSKHENRIISITKINCNSSRRDVGQKFKPYFIRTSIDSSVKQKEKKNKKKMRKKKKKKKKLQQS